MKFLYQLLRVACLIVLPVFFERKELTPQPIQNMLLAFIAGVITAELLLFFIRSQKIRTFLCFLPLITVLVLLFPYRSDIGYFAPHDRVLIYSAIGLSLLYYADRKYIYPVMFP